MNIVFFARRFWPDIGGVEKHVLEISKHLAANGHLITIVTESKDSPKEKLSVKGIQILRIPSHAQENKKLFIWQWLWKHRSLIQEADVIHCHDVFYWYLPFRFLFPQKPVFTTFHGYESYPISYKAIVVRKISEVLSFGNICIGDFITKWYKTRPTYVSYGAVDLIETKQSQKVTNHQSALFFGRLDEQTGIRTYIAAFKLLKIKFPRFALLVIGDGKFKRMVEKTVKVIGFQKNPEQYFTHYRFAFISRYLSILEAMAAKKLVVAVYDNPVKEDYLRMAPFAKFIIIESDPKKLAAKIEFFITHPSLEKKMTEKAYQWVKKQSWEEMVKLYLTLWNKR